MITAICLSAFLVSNYLSHRLEPPIATLLPVGVACGLILWQTVLVRLTSQTTPSRKQTLTVWLTYAAVCIAVIKAHHLTSDEITQVTAGATLHAQSRVAHSHQFIKKRIQDSLSEQDPRLSGLVSALIIGEKRALSWKLREDFKVTGLYHLLVVSGLHISLMASAFSAIIRGPFLLLYASRSITFSTWQVIHLVSMLVSSVAVWWYALLTGLAPPAQRAAIVFSVNQLSPLITGSGYLGTRLMVAALIQFVIFSEPWWSMSVLLSWTSYLMFVSLSLSTRKTSKTDAFSKLVVTQFAVSIFVFVLVDTFSLTGIIWNLVVTPLFLIVLLAAMAWLLCLQVQETVPLLSDFLELVLLFFIETIRKFAEISKPYFFEANDLSSDMYLMLKLVALTAAVAFLLNSLKRLPIGK